jgi:amino acid transporter
MAREKHLPDSAAGPQPGVDAASTRSKAFVTPGRVLVVTSVMLTFISAWRVAAIVLCDLAGTAYYIGGIVESQIGKAAPWFILAVMLFSYAMRSVYIESCSMFTRGGVYRVVKEAMGGSLAKVSVSALLFDYVLTGPISGVSAGQYIIGLVNDVLGHYHSGFMVSTTWGSVAIAAAITLYFWRANVRGIRESSDKALKIMAATTVMGVLMIAWCLLTIAIRPETQHLPPAVPDLSNKVRPEGRPVINEVTGKQQDPLGWLAGTAVAERLRDPSKVNWFSLIGMLGILIAFGHSVLAMSGEETLAQVYREVESPKLPNFKKAAFIVFLYSLLLTSLISFFAVMIIPDGPRTGTYNDNLIGGLAMSVIGPKPARLALHGLVVFVGFLILAGSVNTAIVGSNGVLNRVSEDGVLPAWFLKPHPRYGTTSRLLSIIAGLQLFTIVVSRGDVIVLGEA